MIYKSQEELDAGLVYWQRALRLQDWDCTASFARDRELGGDAFATVECWHQRRVMRIKLLDPVDYPPDHPEPVDHERSLVHELLHTWIDPVATRLSDDDDAALYERELAINVLSKVIVDLKRRAESLAQ